MTLNIVAATKDYVACASDRRLTALNGQVVSENSTKLTAFICAGGHGFVTYNGIGSDQQGNTPSDWLAEIGITPHQSLVDLANSIRERCQPRIDALSEIFRGNPRHSFVIAAFDRGCPAVGLISNYESFKADPLARAAPNLTVELMGATKCDAVALFVTGASLITDHRPPERLLKALKGAAPPKVVSSLMVKLVRDEAYGADRRGAVGTNVQTGIWPAGGEALVQSHAVGGASVQELPNFITPNARMTDVVIGTGNDGGWPKSRYDPVRGRPARPEKRCAKCQSPVPEGNRRCGVCGAKM